MTKTYNICTADYGIPYHPEGYPNLDGDEVSPGVHKTSTLGQVMPPAVRLLRFHEKELFILMGTVATSARVSSFRFNTKCQ